MKLYDEDTHHFSKGWKLQILVLLRVFRGLLLESLDNKWARKAVVVYMQDRGFNSFASSMIKQWSSLLARTRLQVVPIFLQG